MSGKNKTQIVIPAAGQGSRFTAAGFVDPKPFIWSEKRQKRLIEIAIEDATAALGADAGRVLVLLRAEHVHRGRALLGDKAEIVPIGALTTGAASTVQLADPYLDREAPVFVVNSDQTFAIDPARFAEARQRADVAAVPLCFKSDGSSKWSYYDPRTGLIVEKPQVAPDGNNATVGAYWFRKAGEMLDAIADMKAAKFKVNGEYYFAPCHNHLGGVIGAQHWPIVCPVFVRRFAGLGTPEDFATYEKSWEKPPPNMWAGYPKRSPEDVRERARLRQRKHRARQRVGYQPLAAED